MANGAKRYQSERPRQSPRGVDPFSYAQGISTPRAPRTPLPPTPAGAPPGPPTIYEPKITPGEQRSKGAAVIAMSLSEKLDQWSNRFYKKAEVERKRTGYEAGLASGSQMESIEGTDTARQPELLGGTTVYDLAFNKGARIAYQAAIHLDIREQIIKYEIDHPRDGDLFNTKTESYRKTLLAGIDDPETRVFATNKIEEYSSSARSRIYKDKMIEDRAQQSVLANDQLIAVNSEVATAIREGDDRRFMEAVWQRRNLIAQALEAGLIKPSEVSGIRRKMFEDDVFAIYKRDYAESLKAGKGDAVYQEFIDNPNLVKAFVNKYKIMLSENFNEWWWKGSPGQDVEEAARANQQISPGDQYSEIISQGFSPELRERIRSELWGMKSRHYTAQANERKGAATELKMRKKEFTFAVGDAVKTWNDGGEPNNGDKIFVELQWFAKRDPVYARGEQLKLIEAQWGSQIASYFKLLNLEGAESQQNFLIQLKEGLPEGHHLAELYDSATQSWQIGLIDRLQKKHDATWSAINSGNGLEQAVEDGVPNLEIAQLTGGTVQDFLGLVESRYDNAKRAALHWGVDVSKIPPFSVDEISQVQTMWEESMSMDDKLRFLHGIVGGMGKDADAFLKRFDKDKHTSLGWAGAFAQSRDGIVIAGELVRGADMPPEIAAQYMPKSDKLNEAVVAIMGNAFEANLDVSLEVLKAATNLYKWRSFKANDQDSAQQNLVHSERLNKVLSDLTGGFVTLRWDESVAMGNDFTYNIIAPEPNMNEGNTERWLKSITPEEIIAQGGTLEHDPDDGVLTPPDLVARLLNEGGLKLVSIFEGPGQPVKYYLQWHNQGYISAADGDGPFILEHRKEIAQPDGEPKPYASPGWFSSGVSSEHIKKLEAFETQASFEGSEVPLVETLEEGSKEKAHLETAIVKEQVKIHTAGKDIKEQTGADIKDLYVPDPALATPEELEEQTREIMEKLNTEQQGTYFYLRDKGANHAQAMEGALTGTTSFTSD